MLCDLPPPLFGLWSSRPRPFDWLTPISYSGPPFIFASDASFTNGTPSNFSNNYSRIYDYFIKNDFEPCSDHFFTHFPTSHSNDSHIIGKRSLCSVQNRIQLACSFITSRVIAWWKWEFFILTGNFSEKVKMICCIRDGWKVQYNLSYATTLGTTMKWS